MDIASVIIFSWLQSWLKNEEQNKISSKLKQTNNIFYLNMVGFKANIAYGAV